MKHLLAFVVLLAITFPVHAETQTQQPNHKEFLQDLLEKARQEDLSCKSDNDCMVITPTYSPRNPCPPSWIVSRLNKKLNVVRSYASLIGRETMKDEPIFGKACTKLVKPVAACQENSCVDANIGKPAEASSSSSHDASVLTGEAPLTAKFSYNLTSKTARPTFIFDYGDGATEPATLLGGTRPCEHHDCDFGFNGTVQHEYVEPGNYIAKIMTLEGEVVVRQSVVVTDPLAGFEAKEKAK